MSVPSPDEIAVRQPCREPSFVACDAFQCVAVLRSLLHVAEALGGHVMGERGDVLSAESTAAVVADEDAVQPAYRANWARIGVALLVAVSCPAFSGQLLVGLLGRFPPVSVFLSNFAWGLIAVA
jgi:hypothetical protein